MNSNNQNANLEVKDLIIKELEFIQSVITRMASNSFMLKGWLIGILSFIMAFNTETVLTNSPYYAPVLLMPVLIFWYLDAFFLYTEQQYRELYKDVVSRRAKYLFGDPMPDGLNDLFNLDYTRYEDYRIARQSIWAHMRNPFSNTKYQALKDTPSDEQPPLKTKKIPTIFRVMLSKTLLGFYLLPILFVVIMPLIKSEKQEKEALKVEIVQPK